MRHPEQIMRNLGSTRPLPNRTNYEDFMTYKSSTKTCKIWSSHGATHKIVLLEVTHELVSSLAVNQEYIWMMNTRLKVSV